MRVPLLVIGPSIGNRCLLNGWPIHAQAPPQEQALFRKISMASVPQRRTDCYSWIDACSPQAAAERRRARPHHNSSSSSSRVSHRRLRQGQCVTHPALHRTAGQGRGSCLHRVRAGGLDGGHAWIVPPLGGCGSEGKERCTEMNGQQESAWPWLLAYTSSQATSFKCQEATPWHAPTNRHPPTQPTPMCSQLCPSRSFMC